ncbi:serine/threonine-protein kinase [Bradyrhizobium sp. JYMT SZCCT0428]|uniref:serine/threonine-protein kinase n=1 Tax=Bradyrhizobium sp. JYMT SZCCT0428 TaxID=2807673 RepID=UPI001BA794B6|nr:serine/threonine-protein kinase [Bradyrhizobium sp. JYMT SZCCT0428]MBR1155690.1 serine/threonine protein kinase [Bradyrhizobium sp. JYMT SZCCT0428]
MTIVTLNQQWTMGAPIGEGGFGQVFEATNAAGKQAVIKLVRKAPGAEREMLFVDLGGARRVVPIIDSGEHGGFWALVMPRAKESLRAYLDRAGGALSPTDATTILCEIAIALSDLDGRVVHRDLKPENVLLLDGQWCLADFGISRYAAATTSPDTQKHAMTAPYAAPERWRSERATGATDVYSLGVMAFEMLTGARPFLGPNFEDYREQHLHSDVPALKSGTSALRALVSEMLFKAPGARPLAANLLARLERSQQQRTSWGLAKLGDFHLQEVVRRSESERMASEKRSMAELRKDLFRDGSSILKSVQEELIDAVLEAVPSATQDRSGKLDGATISLGEAQLELGPLFETPASPWEWEAPKFDVIAHSGIIVRIPRDRYDYGGRSHSLWYCDALEVGRFEWVEIAFMMSPLLGKSTVMRPFMADPGMVSAKALWNGVSEYQLAWPMESLDSESFIDRWTSWLGDAAQGRLQAPSTMPERETPRNWRQK